jgi:ABC-type transport system substrate-binding protein
MRAITSPTIQRLAALLAAALLSGCGQVWNDPYPAAERGGNILYTAFSQRPKHLDPVQSYSEDEATFLYQIYEPPLQYHYLKRPFQLQVAAAAEMPTLRQFDAAGKLLPAGADPAKIARSEYEIRIRPGIRYQPHPAFALMLRASRFTSTCRRGGRNQAQPRRLPQTGTRELTAEDYVYQIKRLAHPRLHSPVLELMGDYIVGLKDLHARLLADEKTRSAKGEGGGWIDLRNYPMAGVELVDRYTYRVHIKGTYPSFPTGWRCPFCADARRGRALLRPAGHGRAQPEPRLVAHRHRPLHAGREQPQRPHGAGPQPQFPGRALPLRGRARRPGGGPAGRLRQADPLHRQGGVQPREGEHPGLEQVSAGLLRRLRRVVRQLRPGRADGRAGRREPQRRDGRQGHPAQHLGGADGDVHGLQHARPGGGRRERAGPQAAAGDLDRHRPGRVHLGVPERSRRAGHAPDPAGHRRLPGRRGGDQPFVYDWADGKPQRKPVDEARRLLAEAGYPGGRDAKSGEPLVVYLDTTGSGMGDKSTVDWLAKQFRKLDVQLVVRATDYNRFQDKIRKGNAQLFYWGWNADYPDPENFLFLLYGAQGKVKSQGENAANYENAEYDRLFERMKAMPDSPARQAITERMLAILQHDAPWVWGFYEKAYTLQHGWLYNRKPGKIVRNTLKYQRIDVAQRERLRAEWNRPILWPLGLSGCSAPWWWRRR